tara:strand:+ start:763 stop:1410 length:648 start_codon:yes stop_codon:yes gene_type:complete
LLEIFKINKIPKKKWSSDEALNIKPRLSTFFFLCFGLFLFGLGEGLLLLSTIGNSPWSVLAEGIAIKSGLTIGISTFFVSLSVLILWLFLKQKPGIGTIMNIIIIAVIIDITLNIFHPPSSIFLKYILSIFSVLLVGLGSGIYLVSNLGPGPRDGLMTGITRVTEFPIAFVRATIEITVVIIGWYLGGTIGFGTLIFAFGIGPAVAASLFVISKL